MTRHGLAKGSTRAPRVAPGDPPGASRRRRPRVGSLREMSSAGRQRRQAARVCYPSLFFTHPISLFLVPLLITPSQRVRLEVERCKQTEAHPKEGECLVPMNHEVVSRAARSEWAALRAPGERDVPPPWGLSPYGCRSHLYSAFHHPPFPTCHSGPGAGGSLSRRPGQVGNLSYFAHPLHFGAPPNEGLPFCLFCLSSPSLAAKQVVVLHPFSRRKSYETTYSLHLLRCTSFCQRPCTNRHYGRYHSSGFAGLAGWGARPFVFSDAVCRWADREWRICADAYGAECEQRHLRKCVVVDWRKLCRAFVGECGANYSEHRFRAG